MSNDAMNLERHIWCKRTARGPNALTERQADKTDERQPTNEFIA